MSNVLLLTKVFLKNAMFSKVANNTNKKGSNKIGKAIGFTILFAYVIAVFGLLSYQMIDALNQVNQAGLFLGILLLAIATLIIIQSIVSAMNLFYFSQDVVNVLPLPIKPYQILAAKFNVLVITEYFIVFLFALAPFIIYGILTGAGALFYVYGLLILLIFPIFPTLIASFIVIVLMSFSKLVKNKEKMQLIGTILSIVLVLAIQFMFTSKQEMETEELLLMLTQANGMIDLIDDYFITLEPALNTLINYDSLSGGISLLIIIGITLVAYFIFILISQKLYLRGVVGASSSGVRNRKRDGRLSFKAHKLGYQYVEKETIMLFKNPIYFMQCVLPAVIMPIIFAVVFFMNNEAMAELQAVDINNSVGLCIVLGIIAFLLSMIFIPVTAISRDGKNAIFMKYIPISYYKQFLYKMAPSIMISLIVIILVMTIIAINFEISILMIAMCVINAIIMSTIYSYTMQIVDLKRPKLNWDTEYAVVKQNFNMIFGVAFSMIYIILFIAAGVLLSGESLIMSSAVVLAFNVIIGVAIDRYVYTHQNKLFKNIS